MCDKTSIGALMGIREELDEFVIIVLSVLWYHQKERHDDLKYWKKRLFSSNQEASILLQSWIIKHI